MSNNIILIGMPGSGKSTVGVQLAKHMGLDFVDTDLLIQMDQGEKLQDIVDQRGYQVLRDIEADVLSGLELENHVIATGGSAVYSDRAMQHLKSLGVVLFLDVAFPEIQTRITNSESSRGIARPAGQTLEDVYNERVPLYQRYADLTLDNNQPVPMSDIAKALGESE